jgi:hypothetical protein
LVINKQTTLAIFAINEIIETDEGSDNVETTSFSVALMHPDSRVTRVHDDEASGRA